jgi:hypothetical protein
MHSFNTVFQFIFFNVAFLGKIFAVTFTFKLFLFNSFESIGYKFYFSIKLFGAFIVSSGDIPHQSPLT